MHLATSFPLSRYSPDFAGALRAIQTKSSNFVWKHIDAQADTSNIQAKCVVHAEGGLFKTQDWVESGRDYEQSALVGLVEVENAAPLSSMGAIYI